MGTGGLSLMLAVYVLFGALVWVIGLAALRDRAVSGRAQRRAGDRGPFALPGAGGQPRNPERPTPRPKVVARSTVATRSYVFRAPSGDHIYLN